MRRIGWAALGAAVAVSPAVAQDLPQSDLAAAADVVASGEITVTATRGRRDPFDLPWAVSVATREDVQRNGSFVAVNALSRRNAAIWYDERTGTTSDLIIRGFAGFNLLTLVDGNTLSTLWGEGGFGADDMFGKIDPEMVERIEVVRGPASAMYGSNALGAVVNVISRSAPSDFTEEGFRGGGRVRLATATVNDAWSARYEAWAATPDVRLLVGGSAREFDHLEGGGDLGELAPTDGRERNWDFSGDLRTSPGRTLRATVQDVHRDGIKRYYRPFQDNENDREAVGLFWTDTNRTWLWDRFEARAYWQEKVDRRRFFEELPSGRRGALDKIGVATTRTFQVGTQIVKELGGGHVLTGGLSLELDKGDSPDDEQFTYVFPKPKRRDAPLSEWWDGGVYVLDEWRVSEAWSLIASARADRMLLETDVDSAYRPAVGDPRDDEIRETTTAYTGGLGTVWRVRPDLHLVADWSRGYRQNAPNFGIRQLGDGVLVPSGLLDPTTSDNFEVGAKGRSEGMRWEAFVYQSRISNWQGDLRASTFAGRDWFDFDGDGVRDANEDVVEQVEGGDAKLYGIELSARVQPHALGATWIPPSWTVWGSFARNVGRVDGTETHPEEEPLRHVQPTRLLMGLRWDDVDHPRTGLHLELVADMVNRFHDIPSDRRETDLAWREDPQDGSSPLLRSYAGTPGYTILSLYGGANLTEQITLRVGVENLTDKK
jgi:outer membrane receptor protein involved in Fe transport